MAAWGNRNNYKGGVAKWPELRVRVPPDLKAALADVDWNTANAQALKVLKTWHEERKKTQTKKGSRKKT